MSGTCTPRTRLVGLVVVLAFSAPAHAGEPTEPTEPTEQGSWHAGVSVAQKQAAQRELDEGNRLIKLDLFAPSVVYFRRGIERWDHPALHFNTAKALLNLGRADLALTELWLALRHGAAPLGPDLADQAIRSSRLLLDSELVHLVVVSQRAETISLGQLDQVTAHAVLVGPGRWEGVVPLGSIALTVAKPGRGFTRQVQRALRLVVVFPAHGEPSATESEDTDTTRNELMQATLGFVIATPTEAQVAQAPMLTSRRDMLVSELVSPLERSAEARLLCRGASGLLARICRSYDQDMAGLEARFKGAYTEFQALWTRFRGAFAGGIIEVLH